MGDRMDEEGQHAVTTGAPERLSNQEESNSVKSSEIETEGFFGNCCKRPGTARGCSHKRLRLYVILVAIFLLIVSITIGVSCRCAGSPVPQEQPKQGRSDGDGAVLFYPICPSQWLAYEGKCYFFSNEGRNSWTSSQDFCSAYNSSLAVIGSEEEKLFILRFKGASHHWIGLRKGPGQTWRWTDETKFNNMFAIRGEGGDCAYLNNGFAISSRCSITRDWICSHPIPRPLQ